jgi:hypothetical protein
MARDQLEASLLTLQKCEEAQASLNAMKRTQRGNTKGYCDRIHSSEYKILIALF